MTKPKIRKAIFPVAGLGTRFLPATKSIPKEVLTLVDKPLIQYAVDEARAAGIEEFIFVTSKGKSVLEDHFDAAPGLENTLLKKGKTELLDLLMQTTLENGVITCVRQSQALGLGHAVWCARHLIGDEPFAVLLPDDVIASEVPCLKQMVDAYDEAESSMVAAMDVPDEMVSSYGVLAPKSCEANLITVSGMVEKPQKEQAPSNLAVIGRYILSANVMRSLSSIAPGAGGEIQLTDAIAQEISNGKNVYGYRFDGKRYDCGSKLGFLMASFAFAMQRDDLRAELSAFLYDELVMPVAAE